MLTLLFSALLVAASPARFAPSPDSLVNGILASLNDRDLVRLEALSPNKAEFLEVYPFFETDTGQTRREFATGYFLQENRKIMERRVDAEGGRGVVLSRYDIEGPIVPYGPVTLYRGFRIWVKDGDGEREVRVIKSLARYTDGWKIWSFRDN